jgi:YVTN family beta-propeller protein
LFADATVAYNPYGIVYDSANGNLYVANSALSGFVSVLANCESYSYLTPSCQLVTSIPVGSAPTGELYDPVNGYIYVADSASNAVSVIDGSTNTIVANISVGVYPVSLAYDSSSSQVLVTNELSGTVSVIDGSSNSVVATIPIGPNPDGVIYDSVNCNAYVANNIQGGMLSVISTNCEQIASPSQYQVTFQATPSSVNPTVTYQLSNESSSKTATAPFTLNIDSAAQSGFGSNSSQKPLSSGTVVSMIPVSLSDAVVDPANGYLYAITGGGYSTSISVINERSNAIVATIPSIGFGGVVAITTPLVYDSGSGMIYFVAYNSLFSNTNYTLYGVNTTTNTISTTTLIGTVSSTLTYDPSNGNLYSVATCSTTLTPPISCSGYLLYVINGTSGEISSVITNTQGFPPGTPDNAFSTIYNPLNKEIYVLSDLDRLAAFDPSTNTFVANFTVGSEAESLTYVNGDIYVSNTASNSITVINSSNTIVTTFATGPDPGLAEGYGSGAIVYDTQNGNLYVFCIGQIDVINTTTYSLVDTVPVDYIVTSGPISEQIVFNPANSAIYVPDSQDGGIFVINASTISVMPEISTSSTTYAISLNPFSGDLYASDGFNTLVVGSPTALTLHMPSPISISYTYEQTAQDNQGNQYDLVSVTPSSPQTVTNSFVATGMYQKQVIVTPEFPMGSVNAIGSILGALAIFAFVKRKHRAEKRVPIA